MDWKDYSTLILKREAINYQTQTVIKSANNHQAKIRQNKGFLLKDDLMVDNSQKVPKIEVYDATDESKEEEE